MAEQRQIQKRIIKLIFCYFAYAYVASEDQAIATMLCMVNFTTANYQQLA